jgi:hypothetical protein
MEGLLLKLGQQIFHLGKIRTDAERKLSVKDVDRMSEWLEKNATLFIAALPEPYKWNSDHADPSKLSSTTISLPQQSHTTHAAFTVVSREIKPRDPH